MIPPLILLQPEAAMSAIRYRLDRFEGAVAKARSLGYAARPPAPLPRHCCLVRSTSHTRGVWPDRMREKQACTASPPP